MSDRLLVLLTLLLCSNYEAAENFVESGMASLDKVAEVIDARRLVLN